MSFKPGLHSKTMPYKQRKKQRNKSSVLVDMEMTVVGDKKAEKPRQEGPQTWCWVLFSSVLFFNLKKCVCMPVIHLCTPLCGYVHTVTCAPFMYTTVCACAHSSLCTTYVYHCVCVHVYTVACVPPMYTTCQQMLREAEGVGSPTTRIISSFEQSDLSSGNQFHVLLKSIKDKNWTISPATRAKP